MKLRCRALSPMVLAAAPLAVAVLLGQRPPSPQTPIFRANVDVVRVDVLATDKGKPIAGLAATDFEVRDNGVLQTVDLATLADHLSLVIALDVQRNPWIDANAELIRASEVLADALKPADRAWLIMFAERFDLKVGPTSNPSRIRQLLELAPLERGKFLWDTLFASVSLVAGLDGRAVVFVFSDGQESAFKSGWLDEDHAIDALKRGEVAVSAVQPRSVVASPTALERAARATGGTVIEAARNPRLADQFTTLLNEFRLGYVLTFTPRGVTRDDGWHKLSVKLRNRSGNTRAREGYYSGML